MSKPQTYKSTVLATILASAFVLVISIIIITVSSHPSAHAQTLNDSQLNAAAADFCGAGAIGPGSTDSACRNGFRRGYNGDTVAVACNNRPDYTNAQKVECRKGYAAGKDLKANGPAAATSTTGPFFGANQGGNTCGSGPNAIKTKFDFGCTGTVSNPIFDVMLAIIKFLTYGVGIAVTIAIIMSGIQYTTSEGNPEKTMAAKNHIQNALIALMIYLFSFALLNFLIPGGLLT